MGRKTTRRPGRQRQASRPSTFFIVALTTGVILLIVIAIYYIRHPAAKVGGLETRAVETRTC